MKPFGVRTTPFSKLQPSVSPDRLSGCSSFSQSLAASSSTASITSAVASVRPSAASVSPTPSTSFMTNRILSSGAVYVAILGFPSVAQRLAGLEHGLDPVDRALALAEGDEGPALELAHI